MSKPSVKESVTAMTRDVLGPAMKAAGFRRRSGRVFWRDRPDVCHVASVEMNRWGSSDASSFGVALGVFWHRVEAILGNPSVGKMPPPEYRCTFRIDLGRVILPGSFVCPRAKSPARAANRPSGINSSRSSFLF